MLGKLAYRNVKRSAKDYFVYAMTMTLITALMSAFNSLLFSPDIIERFEIAGIMAAMTGIATFFIVVITAWLINYMVRFMLDKRSREFGIYLLLGMGKKDISRLYMRENVMLGTGAFFLGMVLGTLVQQILLAVLYAMLQMDYHLSLQFNFPCVLMTAGCYGGCYVLALFRCRRRFKKMNIRELMDAGSKNEEVKESHEQMKQWFLPLSAVFLLLFGLWLFYGGFVFGWSGGTVIAFLVGLVLVIYLFYTGLSSAVICYVRRKGGGIYKGQNLFLLRQFSSKIKTMRFTMGTLTSLFMTALLGSTVAMMFSDYQNKVLVDKFPFDVQVYSSDVEDDFQDEREILEEKTQVEEIYTYHIYENGTNQVNVWLRTHIACFGTMYQKEDGTPDMEAIAEDDGDGVYCRYDTYMKLSDYNHLRRMLGYEEVPLGEDEYLIHMKKRVYGEVGDISGQITVEGSGGELSPAGCYTEAFSQDGHNGGDYVVVVPDSAGKELRPYYSEMAADIQGEAPADLESCLEALEDEDVYAYLDDRDGVSVGDEDEESGDGESEDEESGEDEETEEEPGMPVLENSCCGSDQIIVYAAADLVRDNVVPEVRYMLSSITFPCFYMGLVFVCIALTVLSVQQLSDSAKYRFRYDVLRKMGLDEGEVSGIIRKQLFWYYLCPALFAAVIAGIIAIYISRKFILYIGLSTSVIQYFGISFLLFFGVYSLYFITTYVSFKRNVRSSL